MCTFFALGIRECHSICRNAHGIEELSERLPVLSPLGFPDEGLPYCDSHCHLDGILSMRRFGQDWPFKTKLCRDYMERKCKWGGRCAYAHGEHELRKRPAIHRADLSDLIKACPPGFSGFVHNCCDEESIEQAVTLVQWGRELSGGAVYVCFGLHPSDYFRYTDSLERLFLDAFERCGDRAVAWGECGLDYYRKPTDEEKVEMCSVFVHQIEVAVGRGLPLVVHSRGAEEDVLDVLRDHLPCDHRVCLHSFQGSMSTFTSFLEEWPNAYFGINGVATYATARSIADLVRAVPLDRLLLETDGPFMIPEPYRYNGGGSHAGHIPRIAEHVAKLKDVALEVVLTHASANVSAMYGIKPHTL